MARSTRIRQGSEGRQKVPSGRVSMRSSTGIRSRVTGEQRSHGGTRWASFACLLIATVWAVQYLGRVCDHHATSCGWLSSEDLAVELSASQEGPAVAYVISITHLEIPDAPKLLDAAEVLRNSILHACRFSSYRCETIAFMKPTVSPEAAEQVQAIGWSVMEKELPVPLEEIRNVVYRERVVKTGCCGADEFLKLHAYTLTEYHRVLHLDVDTLVFHPLDELMEYNASLLYTTDPAMATKGQKSLPVQGGFLLVRPDMEVYERLRDVIREGDWRVGEGWGGSRIGYFYGGATIQGLLPYFYNVLAPGTALEINRCIYNHMSDTAECVSDRYSPTIPLPAAEFDPAHILAGGNKTVPGDGAVAPVLPIKTVHFTQACPKPWHCIPKRAEGGVCKVLHTAWLGGRRAIIQARGLPETEACRRGKGYSPLQRGMERAP